MLLVFEQLLILYIFVFSGYVIGKLKKDKAAHSDILSVLLVNLLLPCKVFNTFSKNFTVSYFKSNYNLLFASLILISVVLTMAFFVSRLLSKHPYERKVYRYSLSITNYSYLGYVLIESVFGEASLTSFIFFGIPFIVYTYTFGYALLTGGGNPIKRLLNPITVSIILGMICGLTSLPLPALVAKAISTASACVGPLSMLLTGMTLSTFAIKELINNKTAYIFTALRLFIIPGTVFLICTLFHFDSIKPMALIITCMPCGLNTIVFPRLVGEDCKTGARLALISHVFALISIPFWLSLLL